MKDILKWNIEMFSSEKVKVKCFNLIQMCFQFFFPNEFSGKVTYFLHTFHFQQTAFSNIKMFNHKISNLQFHSPPSDPCTKSLVPKQPQYKYPNSLPLPYCPVSSVLALYNVISPQCKDLY